MVDLGLILQVLSGASTIAVILGIPFILLQMRQNARLVESANRQTELVARQNRSEVLLHLAEHMADRGFILQRKTARDIVAKFAHDGWDGFVDSVEGFEIRALALQYESAAMMVKMGLLDEQTLVEALGYTTVVDWRALGPAIVAFEKVWGHALTFPNFRWLAERSEAYWREHGAGGSIAQGPPSAA